MPYLVWQSFLIRFHVFAEDRNWHSREVADTLRLLETSSEGLTSQQARERQLRYGPNELEEKKQVSPLQLLAEQFKSFLIIVLLLAAAVSAVLAVRGEGEFWDPVLIVVIVLFAAILGFVQEYHSEKAMESLRRMTSPSATVVRDGEEKEVPSREIVPGDVVVIETGDRLPADGRLIEVFDLKTDEAALTGESLPVAKTVAASLASVGVSVADRRDMVYMGTAAVYGRARAVVTGTGMATEFGKIAAALQKVEAPPTPLQASLDRVGKVLAVSCLSICAAVAGIGLAIGIFDRMIDAFIWGISLAVAAVPEALPAVVTICLALGVQRMAKRHALVRRLTAVETLGCTSYICSDKTGTLTQNEMTVRKVYANSRLIDVSGVGYEPRGEFRTDGQVLQPQQEPHLARLLQIGVLCNDSRLLCTDDVWHIRGDPTEGALVVASAKAGLWQAELDKALPRVSEIAFSSERKRMTTVHGTGSGRVAYTKGAPEVILASCNRMYADGLERSLTARDREAALQANQQMAAGALRVLGVAYKPLSSLETGEEVERDQVFVGLLGMIDPPRDEVREAIKRCNEARIKSVMITGDHRLTAMAIAEELGLMRVSIDGLALSGAGFDELSDEGLDGVVEELKVYARVSPAHKLRIVEALQKKGHIVAMTGDGVNDAPALKRADIGIAMGISGTDVSKEASAMVLTDDNFASIVNAIEEGRTIFANIKKFLMYLLSSNLGEILLMLLAFVVSTATGYHALPLVAVQLLFINLVTDGLPALALAVDPPEPGVMQQPPRSRRGGVFTRAVLNFIGGVGAWTGIVSLAVFLWALGAGRSALEAQGLCFVTLIMVELFNAFNCRSERRSIFRINPLTNKWLIWASLSSLLLTLLVVYLPFLQRPFHTFAMSWSDWLVVTAAGATVFVAAEVAKLVNRRKYPV